MADRMHAYFYFVRSLYMTSKNEMNVLAIIVWTTCLPPFLLHHNRKQNCAVKKILICNISSLVIQLVIRIEGIDKASTLMVRTAIIYFMWLDHISNKHHFYFHPSELIKIQINNKDLYPKVHCFKSIILIL